MIGGPTKTGTDKLHIFAFNLFLKIIADNGNNGVRYGRVVLNPDIQTVQLIIDSGL